MTPMQMADEIGRRENEAERVAARKAHDEKRRAENRELIRSAMRTPSEPGTLEDHFENFVVSISAARAAAFRAKSAAMSETERSNALGDLLRTLEAPVAVFSESMSASGPLCRLEKRLVASLSREERERVREVEGLIREAARGSAASGDRVNQSTTPLGSARSRSVLETARVNAARLMNAGRRNRKD